MDCEKARTIRYRDAMPFTACMCIFYEHLDLIRGGTWTFLDNDILAKVTFFGNVSDIVFGMNSDYSKVKKICDFANLTSKMFLLVGESLQYMVEERLREEYTPEMKAAIRNRVIEVVCDLSKDEDQNSVTHSNNNVSFNDNSDNDSDNNNYSSNDNIESNVDPSRVRRSTSSKSSLMFLPLNAKKERSSSLTLSSSSVGVPTPGSPTRPHSRGRPTITTRPASASSKLPASSRLSVYNGQMMEEEFSDDLPLVLISESLKTAVQPFDTSEKPYLCFAIPFYKALFKLYPPALEVFGLVSSSTLRDDYLTDILGLAAPLATIQGQKWCLSKTSVKKIAKQYMAHNILGPHINSSELYFWTGVSLLRTFELRLGESFDSYLRISWGFVLECTLNSLTQRSGSGNAIDKNTYVKALHAGNYDLLKIARSEKKKTRN
eukprot:Awhi_evm1s7534